MADGGEPPEGGTTERGTVMARSHHSLGGGSWASGSLTPATGWAEGRCAGDGRWKMADGGGRLKAGVRGGGGARPVGFEPTTIGLEIRCSNPLSYGRVACGEIVA
jgi:hypothetical protein